jgi:hypothetical protein
MATIPDGFKDVLTKKKAFANLATVGADGGRRRRRCGSTGTAPTCASTPPRVG